MVHGEEYDFPRALLHKRYLYQYVICTKQGGSLYLFGADSTRCGLKKCWYQIIENSRFCAVVVKQLLQAKRSFLSRKVSISCQIGLQLRSLSQQLNLWPAKCSNVPGLFVPSGQFRERFIQSPRIPRLRDNHLTISFHCKLITMTFYPTKMSCKTPPMDVTWDS